MCGHHSDGTEFLAFGMIGVFALCFVGIVLMAADERDKRKNAQPGVAPVVSMTAEKG